MSNQHDLAAMPTEPTALRRSIDDTLRGVADGDGDDALMRAAWYLLTMESSRRCGLDDPRSFLKYYLENYAQAVRHGHDLDVEHVVERVLDGADTDELADYVRDHELRSRAVNAIRRARGEPI